MFDARRDEVSSLRSTQSGFLQESNWKRQNQKRSVQSVPRISSDKIIWSRVNVEETHIEGLPVNAECAQDDEESPSG